MNLNHKLFLLDVEALKIRHLLNTTKIQLIKSPFNKMFVCTDQGYHIFIEGELHSIQRNLSLSIYRGLLSSECGYLLMTPDLQPVASKLGPQCTHEVFGFSRLSPHDSKIVEEAFLNFLLNTYSQSYVSFVRLHRNEILDLKQSLRLLQPLDDEPARFLSQLLQQQVS